MFFYLTRNWSAILVPLHFHGGIADRGELRLKVGVPSFLELSQVMEWADEMWLLGGAFFHTFAARIFRVILQLLDILQAVGVLAGAFDGSPGLDAQDSARFSYACSAGHATYVLAEVLHDDAEEIQGDETKSEDSVYSGA